MFSPFDFRKREILKNIEDGVDFSPKGSIDLPIIDLIHLINSHPNFVTTSSCSGRISVFETVQHDVHHAKGVRWLLVKHSTLLPAHVIELLKNTVNSSDEVLITIKCEPMILHIECKDLESANSLHKIAKDCGYRESGISIGQVKIILAIRTTAFGMEVPLKYGERPLLETHSIEFIVNEMNKRLLNNFMKIQKLFQLLKISWQWPSFRCLNTSRSIISIPSGYNASNIQRWGHSAALFQANSRSSSKSPMIAVTGGYGLSQHEPENSIVKSSSDKNDRQGRRGMPSVVFTSHADDVLSIENEKSLPTFANMHSVSINLQNMKTDTEYILLSGGRSSPSNALSCIQSVVALSFFQGEIISFVESGDIPPPRWGHTLTSCEFKNESVYFLYGGRDDRVVFSDSYLLHCYFDADAEIRFIWRKLNIALPSLFFHASCVVPITSQREDTTSVAVIHGGLDSLDSFTSNGDFFTVDLRLEVSYAVTRDNLLLPRSANDDSSGDHLNRFGHTLNNLGGKSLLLVGGSHFNNEILSTDRLMAGQSKSILLVDLFSDSADRLSIISIREPTLLPMKPFSTISRQSSDPADNDASSEEDIIPCVACRCHHQTTLNPRDNTLYVSGGGCLCLGFGPHFCTSLALQMDMKIGLVDKDASFNSQTLVKDSTASSMNEISQIESSVIVEVAPSVTHAASAIIISKASVKAIKTLLQTNGWNDKKRRITTIDSDFVRSHVVSLLPGNHSEIVEWSSAETSDDFAANSMAVPTSQDFIQLLLDPSTLMHENLKRQLYEIIQKESVIAGYQASIRPSRSTLNNSYQSADNFLTNISKNYNFPAEALQQLPKKYEIIGDILMIPDDALQGKHWDSLVVPSDSLTGQEIWRTLASFFSAKKVAKKARIEGPKRESKVLLLLPPLDQPLETGPSSPGWVTVQENGIFYGFDITRVMFCSGNVTERMRMAREVCKGEIIVDLYCGIGYYTLPFLVHGKAAHVHACEWNANSIISLNENLKRMKVSDRCSVHYGDNAVSVVEKRLDDIADRVSLGLLPSSENGWDLAARVLKRTGGKLHVHENVREDLIAEWIPYMLQKFESHFINVGKSFHLTCNKVERVKSYAPRVLHIVADVDCFPL